MFENIKYGRYTQNADFDDLPIENEQRLFINQPIDFLTNNIVKGLKVSSTKISFDNRINESNPQNANFGDLRFDGDERLSLDNEYII